MQKKIQKIFFASEIIASQIVAINCLFKKRLLVIGSHWLNKQS